MINIILDETVNGYTVSVFDSAKTGKQLPEHVERYIDALFLIKTWVGMEFDKEVKKIHAAMQVI